MMTDRILILYGDPHQENSVANRAILKTLAAELPQAEIDDLFSLYPDFQIDAASEQEKLKKADLVILQDPIYWYNVPSLTRRWFEEVLTYGWAYGEGGTALSGKKVIIGLTAGGDAASYGEGPDSVIPSSVMIRPIELIFRYCNMEVLGTVFTPSMPGQDPEKFEAHARKMLELVQRA